VVYTVIYYFYMVNRVKREEAHLRAVLGAPYAEYCAAVRRFLPDGPTRETRSCTGTGPCCARITAGPTSRHARLLDRGRGAGVVAVGSALRVARHEFAPGGVAIRRRPIWSELVERAHQPREVALCQRPGARSMARSRSIRCAAPLRSSNRCAGSSRRGRARAMAERDAGARRAPGRRVERARCREARVRQSGQAFGDEVAGVG